MPTPAKPKAKRRKPLVIAGTRIQRGQTYNLRLNFSESYTGVSISLPIQVISAPKPGPRLFMTALVHGDELNGLGIMRELLIEDPIKLVRGTVVAVPIVNVYGVENNSRYLPDRRDLNRAFPGSPTGSLSARLAHVVFSQIIQQCDLGIDFHTAAVGRTNYPNVRGDISDPKVKELAQAFGCGFIVDGSGPDGSLRSEAVKAGVPTIILEAGEIWKIEPGIVELGVQGSLNVLRHYDMIEGEPTAPPFQTVIRKTTWVRAERGGVLKYYVAPGDVVKKGQCLADCLDIFGGEETHINAPQDGVIVGMATMPMVKPGDAVFHVANVTEHIARLERQYVTPRKRGLHQRIQRQLATNILVKDADDDNGAGEDNG